MCVCDHRHYAVAVCVDVIGAVSEYVRISPVSFCAHYSQDNSWQQCCPSSRKHVNNCEALVEGSSSSHNYYTVKLSVALKTQGKLLSMLFVSYLQ